jgi:hypothetical protein
MRQPVLHCFDIDGTVAEGNAFEGKLFDGSADSHAAMLALRAYPNLVQLIRQTMAAPSATVMFCTGRPRSLYGPTWRWLNRHLRLAESGKAVSVVCRPDEVSLGAIPQYKLSELVQAVRRVRPTELRCYDDNIQSLRLFGTLAPMVKTLRLFRCENGVATAWSL